jgi:hypothetical protein
MNKFNHLIIKLNNNRRRFGDQKFCLPDPAIRPTTGARPSRKRWPASLGGSFAGSCGECPLARPSTF